MLGGIRNEDIRTEVNVKGRIQEYGRRWTQHIDKMEEEMLEVLGKDESSYNVKSEQEFFAYAMQCKRSITRI